MIYFLIFLFLEVMISSSLAGSIGGLVIFFEIIFSAIMGISILKNFKFSLMENIQKARAGEMTQQEFIKTNVSRAIGALLLIIPGLFSDILGFLMLIGLLPLIISKFFQFKVPSQDNTNGYPANFNPNQKTQNNTTYKGVKNDEKIIDVKIIDDNDSTK